MCLAQPDAVVVELPPPDKLIGVKCTAAGCNTVFRTEPAEANAHAIIDCGHCVCGGCVPASTPGTHCPACSKPIIRTKLCPGFSEAGVLVATDVAVGEEDGGGAEEAEVEEQPCATCAGDEVTTVATHKCTDCPGGKYLCDDDAATHLKRSKHNVIPLDRRGAAAAVKPPATVPDCKEHGLPLSKFCEDCTLPLCVECAFTHATSTDTKHHRVKGIMEVTGLAARAQAWIAPATQASAALDASAGGVKVALKQLFDGYSCLVSDVTTAEAAAQAAVKARFDALRRLLKAELDERKKALSSQARELTIAAAQLSASVRLCEQKLAAKNNVGLADAANMAVALEPLLKPVGELAAQPDMALRKLDVGPLVAALAAMGEFIPHPVDAAASEVISATLAPPVGDAFAAAGGGGEGVRVEDAIVRFIPRGSAKTLVQLSLEEVELTVNDADGAPAGTARGELCEDGSLLFKLECAPGVERPVVTLHARGELIRAWTSRPLVRVCLLCVCVCARNDCDCVFSLFRSYRRSRPLARSFPDLAAHPSCLASLAARTT